MRNSNTLCRRVVDCRQLFSEPCSLLQVFNECYHSVTYPIPMDSLETPLRSPAVLDNDNLSRCKIQTEFAHSMRNPLWNFLWICPVQSSSYPNLQSRNSLCEFSSNARFSMEISIMEGNCELLVAVLGIGKWKPTSVLCSIFPAYPCDLVLCWLCSFYNGEEENCSKSDKHILDVLIFWTSLTHGCISHHQDIREQQDENIVQNQTVLEQH